MLYTLQSADWLKQRPMVLSTLLERWFPASQPGKCHYGHRCCRRSQRVDMYPWAGPDPNLPPPDSRQRTVQHDQRSVGGDAEELAGSPRYPAVGGPAAGDFGDDGLQQLRTRYSRSSSSLEQVPEEIGVDTCQDSALMPPATCSIRRARYHNISATFHFYYHA